MYTFFVCNFLFPIFECNMEIFVLIYTYLGNIIFYQY